MKVYESKLYNSICISIKVWKRYLVTQYDSNHCNQIEFLAIHIHHCEMVIQIQYLFYVCFHVSPLFLGKAKIVRNS